MKYTQIDGNSKGMVVEIVAEDDFRKTLKHVANGMEYTVSSIDFKKHYRAEGQEDSEESSSSCEAEDTCTTIDNPAVSEKDSPEKDW